MDSESYSDEDNKYIKDIWDEIDGGEDVPDHEQNYLIEAAEDSSAEDSTESESAKNKEGVGKGASGKNRKENDGDTTEDDVADEADEANEVNEADADETDTKFNFVDISAAEHNKEIFIVKPEDRITSNVMNAYEMAEAISIRAKQISIYNNCMVSTEGLSDPIKMAKKELMERKIPLMLRRFVGERRNKLTGELQSYYEDFDPNEMAFSVIYTDVL